MNKFNIEIIECYHIAYPVINTCVGSDMGEQSEITVQSLEHTHAFFHYVYIQKCDQGKIVIAHEEYPLTVGHIYMVKPNTLHLIKVENCELIELKFNTNDSELILIWKS